MVRVRRFIIIALTIGFTSCSNVREEGDVSGIYCRRYEIANIGNMDSAFINADILAKVLTTPTDSTAEYQSNLSKHTIRYSMTVPIHDHIFDMDVRISGENSVVTIWFGFDRFIQDKGKTKTIATATNDEMKTAFKIQDAIYGQFKTAMKHN